MWPRQEHRGVTVEELVKQNHGTCVRVCVCLRRSQCSVADCLLAQAVFHHGPLKEGPEATPGGDWQQQSEAGAQCDWDEDCSVNIFM